MEKVGEENEKGEERVRKRGKKGGGGGGEKEKVEEEEKEKNGGSTGTLNWLQRGAGTSTPSNCQRLPQPCILSWPTWAELTMNLPPSMQFHSPRAKDVVLEVGE
jgi:hypothetical protein